MNSRTCLQSLRLTPPLRAAENKSLTTLRMHTIIIFCLHSWTNFSVCIVERLHCWIPPNWLATWKLIDNEKWVQLSRQFSLFYRNSQSESSIYPPSCDWLSKLCISKLIKVSFISSYGVVIFITCLQSLRLTPPLRAAEKNQCKLDL